MIDSKNLPWKGVPLEFEEKWREVFTASQEGLDLSAACPVCGRQELHRYYQGRSHRKVATVSDRIQSIGSLWKWCSGCRSYEHSSVLVPEWWSPPELNFDASKLTAEPEVLEQAIRNERMV